MKKPLILLTGPTAVGKSKLAIELAKAVGGEIISADSMQVYRYMDIGSAKIKPHEMKGITHYLIDVLDPFDDFHVVRFQTMAKEALARIYEKGKIPIVTGGTGFYIQALLKDVDFEDTPKSKSYRKTLEELAAVKGSEYLHDMLSRVDAEAASDIHENNTKRVIRALEYYHQTGEPISVHNKRERDRESPYQYVYFVLNDIRAKLYAQIDQRVETMIQEGLLEEVKRLAGMGYTKDMVSMQGLGYKELLAFLNGEGSLDEAVDAIKRDTRHYAKRQITWFKREENVIWINKEAFAYEDDKILAYILQICKEKGIV